MGPAVAAESFMEALSSLVDPTALLWIWITRADTDDPAALERLLDLTPAARLLTNMFSGSWPRSVVGLDAASGCPRPVNLCQVTARYTVSGVSPVRTT